jgi:hypothetical protein
VFLRVVLVMMSSVSSPDFRATLRRQQRHSNAASLSSSSMHGLSASSNAAAATQATQPTTSTAVALPDSRTLDPTFEPLERAGRAINDGITKDDQFPQLDQLVQRISISKSVLIS